LTLKFDTENLLSWQDSGLNTYSTSGETKQRYFFKVFFVELTAP